MGLNIVHWLLKLLLKLLYFVRYEGRENIPEGAAVLCGNHTALFDPLFVMAAFKPGQLPHTIAKKELFKHKWFGAILRWAKVFPVDRGQADLRAIKTALDVLRRGEKLIIFPEGTRTDDPTESSAKHGAALFAMKTDAYVQPIFITKGHKIPFRPIKVIFGKPYKIELDGRKPTQEDYAREADEMMRRVYALGEVKHG